MTDKGASAVEDLRLGDMVQTLDHGLQPLRWIGIREIDVIDLAVNPKLRPLRIRSGALGDGLPEQDLMVSPQHRMLVRSKIAQRLFGVDEVLIPAVKLLNLSGIERVTEPVGTTYFHLLFDQHEVIFPNGTPSESLYLGEQAMKALPMELREEIIALFPEIADGNTPPQPARTIVQKNAAVQKLVERAKKNQQALVYGR